MKKPIIKAAAEEEEDQIFFFFFFFLRFCRNEGEEVKEETLRNNQSTGQRGRETNCYTLPLPIIINCLYVQPPILLHTHMQCINTYAHSWAAIRRALIASPIAGTEGQGHIHLEHRKQT